MSSISSWCDKLASTPAIGFWLTPHYAPGDTILQGITPLLNQWVTGEKPNFTVGRQHPFDTTIVMNDGFQYDIDSTRCAVQFVHRLKAKPVSGGLPVMEMTSSAQPYTELLAEASSRLVAATLAAPMASTRKVIRVGVMSTTRVSDADIPPGLTKFINFVTRPWGGKAIAFAFNIVSPLGEVSGASDRCSHSLQKPEDTDELLTIAFDWQRNFTEGHPVTEDSLKEILHHAQRSALRYFEDLAVGNLFDENILSATA